MKDSKNTLRLSKIHSTENLKREELSILEKTYLPKLSRAKALVGIGSDATFLRKFKCVRGGYSLELLVNYCYSNSISIQLNAEEMRALKIYHVSNFMSAPSFKNLTQTQILNNFRLIKRFLKDGDYVFDTEISNVETGDSIKFGFIDDILVFEEKFSNQEGKFYTFCVNQPISNPKYMVGPLKFLGIDKIKILHIKE